MMTDEERKRYLETVNEYIAMYLANAYNIPHVKKEKVNGNEVKANKAESMEAGERTADKRRSPTGWYLTSDMV